MSRTSQMFFTCWWTEIVTFRRSFTHFKIYFSIKSSSESIQLTPLTTCKNGLLFAETRHVTLMTKFRWDQTCLQETMVILQSLSFCAPSLSCCFFCSLVTSHFHVMYLNFDGKLFEAETRHEYLSQQWITSLIYK